MWLCVTSHSQNRKKKTKNRQFSIKRTENKITLVFFSFFILDSIKWYTKIQLHLNSVNKNRPNVHHVTNSASQWLTPWGQWRNAWIHSQYSLSTDGICQSIHQCNKPFVSKCPGGVKPSGRAVFICLLQHSCGFVCPVKRTEFCATMTVNANNRIHRTEDITSIQDIWNKTVSWWQSCLKSCCFWFWTKPARKGLTFIHSILYYDDLAHGWDCNSK